MSQDAVERVLGRLITDEKFRERAMDSLARACQCEGFILSNDERSALAMLDLMLFERVAIMVDDSIKRS